jgi:hypothetical protein
VIQPEALDDLIARGRRGLERCRADGGEHRVRVDVHLGSDGHINAAFADRPESTAVGSVRTCVSNTLRALSTVRDPEAHGILFFDVHLPARSR